MELSDGGSSDGGGGERQMQGKLRDGDCNWIVMSIIPNSALKTYTFGLKEHLSETSKKELEHVKVQIISFCLNRVS